MFAVICNMKRRAITVSPGGQLCKFILMLIPVFVRWHYLPERWNLFLRHHASCKSCVLAAVTRVESRRDDAPPWVIKRENRPPNVIKERTVSTRQEMAFLPLQFLFPSSFLRERVGEKKKTVTGSWFQSERKYPRWLMFVGTGKKNINDCQSLVFLCQKEHSIICRCPRCKRCNRICVLRCAIGRGWCGPVICTASSQSEAYSVS